jgi:hypothetical protein
VRAISKAAASVCAPGKDQSDKIPFVASMVWTRVVKCSTSPAVISGDGLLASGGVANADPSRNSVFWIDSVHARISAFFQMLRAKPNTEFNSSTDP